MLLREVTENVVAFFDIAFENLKETFSGNVQVARAHVIRNGKHLTESLQERRNSKWQMFERKINFGRLKFVNMSDRERRGKMV